MKTNVAALGLKAAVPAWAKVNLTLHVIGQRADGYHLLDSLVVRAGVGDLINVAPSEKLELYIDGPYADAAPLDDRNLVVQAARLLDGSTGRGARIHLTKVLPAAAGIGGGSADAAAALKALSVLWGVPVPQDVSGLGADVPVCLFDQPQRMRGVGDELEPAGPLPSCWLVLVNPNKSASTPEIFKRLDNKLNPPMPQDLPVFQDAPAFAGWLGMQRNDLEIPAIKVVPEIADCLESLSDALIARMSGSGATCFGIYETEAQAEHAAARIGKARPDWWVAAAAVLS